MNITGTYFVSVAYSSQGVGELFTSLRDFAQPDTQIPTAILFTPADEATGVNIGSNISITFSESIQRGTGNIVPKTTSGSTVATYDSATSNQLSIQGSVLTINPASDLAYFTGYQVEFALARSRILPATTTRAARRTTSKQRGEPIVGTAASDFRAVVGFESMVWRASTPSPIRATMSASCEADGWWSVDGSDALKNVERLKLR